MWNIILENIVVEGARARSREAILGSGLKLVFILKAMGTLLKDFKSVSDSSLLIFFFSLTKKMTLLCGEGWARNTIRNGGIH